MGYIIKNISYLLNKKDSNYNKTVIFKINKNQKTMEYKIIPYQEIVFDSNLLPVDIKKMEMIGVVKCSPVNLDFIDSLSNSKGKTKEKIKEKFKPKPQQKKVTRKRQKKDEIIVEKDEQE